MRANKETYEMLSKLPDEIIEIYISIDYNEKNGTWDVLKHPYDRAVR